MPKNIPTKKFIIIFIAISFLGVLVLTSGNFKNFHWKTIFSFIKPVFGQSSYAGINIDPANPGCSSNPEYIRQLGAGWVRFVYRPGLNYDDFINRMSSSGIKILLILNAETLAPSGGVDDAFISRFADAAGEIAGRFGDKVSAYEIWNEPDIYAGTSIHMDADIYAKLLKSSYSAIKANSNSQVLIGGLAKANENLTQGLAYLDEVVSNAGNSFDAIGVHPYNPDPATVTTIVDGYRFPKRINSRFQNHGKPVWVTEFGYGWSASDQTKANYLSSVCANLKQKVANAIWYSWSDAMGPGYGLLDTSCAPKQTYYAFQQSCVGINPSPPDTPIPPGGEIPPITPDIPGQPGQPGQPGGIDIEGGLTCGKEIPSGETMDKSAELLIALVEGIFKINERATEQIKETEQMLELAEKCTQASCDPVCELIIEQQGCSRPTGCTLGYTCTDQGYDHSGQQILDNHWSQQDCQNLPSNLTVNPNSSYAIFQWGKDDGTTAGWCNIENPCTGGSSTIQRCEAKSCAIPAGGTGCPISEIENKFSEVDEAYNLVKEVKDEIVGLVDGKKESLCDKINEDIRTGSEKLLCIGCPIFKNPLCPKISKKEVIERKLSKTREEFDKCYIPPSDWEDVTAGRKAGKLLQSCEVVEGENLPRQTKTIKEIGGEKFPVCTSLHNWFCCTGK